MYFALGVSPVHSYDPLCTTYLDTSKVNCYYPAGEFLLGAGRSPTNQRDERAHRRLAAKSMSGVALCSPLLLVNRDCCCC